MNDPILVEHPPLYPHCDLFSHATENLVDTGITMMDNAPDGRLVEHRMYLSLPTAEQVARVYGRTMRTLQRMEQAQAAVDTFLSSDTTSGLREENRILRHALMAVISRRTVTKATVDALGAVLGKDVTEDEIAFINNLKTIGV